VRDAGIENAAHIGPFKIDSLLSFLKGMQPFRLTRILRDGILNTGAIAL
jgi:hypothetical protein